MTGNAGMRKGDELAGKGALHRAHVITAKAGIPQEFVLVCLNSGSPAALPAVVRNDDSSKTGA